MKQMFNHAAENKFNSPEIKIYDDIVKLRQKLNIDEKISIVEYFSDLYKKQQECEANYLKYQSQIDNLKKENDFMNCENIKLEAVRKENNKWKDWSRSILRQFYNSTSSDTSNDLIRSRIEEIMLSAISQRKILNKIEILRREKSLLNTRGQFLAPPPRKQITKSIRPLLLVLACAHRLQNRI